MGMMSNSASGFLSENGKSNKIDESANFTKPNLIPFQLSWRRKY
jgi:hypothetical protein